MTEDEINHREIIIVRRADPGHDEGHHGGVWKIAFADFMTAMMAFFLVMWLINAANEETKKAVASYFTPIKLTDRTSNPKGLNDPKYGQTDDSSEPEEETSTFASGGKLNQKVPDPVRVDEQALFTDPYAILSEIAGGLVSGEPDAEDPAASEQDKAALGISGGAAFHDPFDPSSWNTELGLARQASPGGSSDVSRDAEADQGEKNPGGSTAESAQTDASSPDKAGAQATRADVETARASEAGREPADPAGKLPEGDAGEKAEAAAARLREALAGLTRAGGSAGPNVEIKADGAGVLISVSDEFKFGMFDIGSSVPRRETVEAMAEIGKALSKIEGTVIVAGHTDARKYSGGNYDNWRLSTDRAHIARYMLIRGGLGEDRIERVEGFAAARPKTPDDPMAATNRRIEIMVKLP